MDTSHEPRLDWLLARMQIHSRKGEHEFNARLALEHSSRVHAAVVLHYEAGRHDEAARLLEAYETHCGALLTLDTALCDSPLGLRVANTLADELGAITFGDLRGVTQARLRGINGLGDKTADMITDALAEAVANSQGMPQAAASAAPCRRAASRAPRRAS